MVEVMVAAMAAVNCHSHLLVPPTFEFFFSSPVVAARAKAKARLQHASEAQGVLQHPSFEHCPF